MDDETLGRLAARPMRHRCGTHYCPWQLAFVDDGDAGSPRCRLLEREDVLRAAIDAAARHDRIEDFAALLTEVTPQLVWDALVEVRDDMPAKVRAMVAERARAADQDAVVTAITEGSGKPAPAKRTRSKPPR